MEELEEHKGKLKLSKLRLTIGWKHLLHSISGELRAYYLPVRDELGRKGIVLMELECSEQLR